MPIDIIRIRNQMYKKPKETPGGRSAEYQYLYHEISSDFSSGGVAAQVYSNTQALHTNTEASEEILDINEEITTILLALVKTTLTKRQLEVWELTAEGYTQCEIANILNINQSTISHVILGSQCYTGQEKKGGMFLRMRKELLVCEEFRLAVQKLHDLEIKGGLNYYYLASTMFLANEDFQSWLFGTGEYTTDIGNKHSAAKLKHLKDKPLCSTPECSEVSSMKGLCPTHYYKTYKEEIKARKAKKKNEEV